MKMAHVWRTILIFVFAHFVVSESGKHKQCGKPEDYPEMQLDDKYRFTSVFNNGQNVEYKCAPGYKQKDGSPMSRCKDGRWTPVEMKCQKKKCKPLRAIKNGRYNQEGQSYGDKVTHECNKGYILKGDRVRVCQDDDWSGTSPTCEVVECPVLVIANGQLAPQAVEFDTVVQITCSAGFELHGEPQLQCGVDGSWTPSVPTCEPMKCPVITIPNGQAAPSAVVYNTSVQITCSPGFKLNGAQNVTCGADGSWTPKLPTCETVSESGKHKQCGKPEDYPEMQLDDKYRFTSVFNNGKNVEYKCAPGYKQKDGSPRSRCMDGRWTPVEMKCQKKKCKPLRAIKNGQYNQEGQSYGDKVTHECNKGFVLRGDRVRVCQDDDWNGTSPICEEVKCPVIVIANGQAAPQVVMFDTVVQITCSPGFELNGDPQLKCGEDGSWSPNLPTCEPVKCPVINIPNGQAVPQALEFDTVVQITCSPGFKLIGAYQLRCRADGSWAPCLPKCEQVKCQALNILNGQTSPNDGLYNTTVQVTCLSGYSLTGAQQIQCGADGYWKPKLPFEPIICSPPEVENAVMETELGLWYIPNEVVTFSCMDGFFMTGSSMAKCGPNGQWLGLPTCSFES
ncbi:sushi, von Willebrand factor type A, EGF and pentraxin domain-containing protein 1-like [Xyrauchen texanus]|uniref:sushi, von Willebrand factor type A, EGF and pentraxin domain-containing protein 1-like n=1 Tax=Xyrauchen texanus TaxID=154827 RepID=UPI002242B4EF|nr:sushi, von Willebrand factor type A, EGF and pentraxin domain-containing protein 1-like [Xyrauchen texanus]